MSRMKALPCTISRGIFSGDRTVKLMLADGTEHKALVPRLHCYDSVGRQISEREAMGEMEGLVACLVIDPIDDEQLLVEIPSGERVAVLKESVGSLPGSSPESQSRRVLVNQ